MVHHGHNDEVDGRIPSLNLPKGHREDGIALWGGEMGVSPVEKSLEAALLWPIQEYVRW